VCYAAIDIVGEHQSETRSGARETPRSEVCVDRHNTVNARRVEAGSFECSLPEGGCRNVELAGALGGALDGNGGKVDSRQMRSGLL
jgi:hypothetical protein